MPQTGPHGKLAGVAVGADEGAADRPDRGHGIQAQVAGGSGVDLLDGRPSAADPHDRHHPPQRLGHVQRLLGRVQVTTGIWSLGSLMGIACSGSSR